jgi:hypothetical protein
VLSDPFPMWNEIGEHAVLILGIAILLATVSVASFPRWQYSRRWGYAPCTTAAIMLFFVALIAAWGKSSSGAATNVRIAAAPAIETPAPAPPAGRYTLESLRQPVPLRRAIPIDATTQANLQ